MSTPVPGRHFGKAQRLQGYMPTYDVRTGLAEAVGQYVAQYQRRCRSEPTMPSFHSRDIDTFKPAGR